MKLFYYHVAEDVPNGIIPDSAVVVDVLRATTTIAWALKNGAEAVRTFTDLNELKVEASKWPKDFRILLGERGGKCLEGFDLGNSPLGVKSDLVSGKRIFMSTTNGTKSLRRVAEAKTLFTMALPNRRAIGEKLLRDRPDNVFIVGSGWEGSYSLEDSLAAGALGSFLLETDLNSVEICNDELTSALALWKTWEDNVEGCLRAATHGKRLERIGNHDDDFTCCSELDKLDVVPTQTEIGVLRAD